jgi:hypothetical protein
MSVTNGPRLATMIAALTGDSFDVDFRKFLRQYHALVQCSIKSKTLTAPPGSPANGDAYIVGASATGAWATHDKAIALWTTDNPATPSGLWEFYGPTRGFLAFNEADSSVYAYDGTTWTAIAGGAVGGVTSVAGHTGAVTLAESDIGSLVTDLATLASAIAAVNTSVAAGTVNPGYFISAGMGLNAIYGPSLTPGTISTTNNQITGFKFPLPFAIPINKISVNVVGAVSGKHANFGIYDATGTTKILDSGALLCTAPGIKTVSKTATLPIGNYIYVQSADDSGVQVDALNLPGLSGLINVGVTRTFQAANPTVAGVLPSTLGALTPDSIFLAMAIALFQT